MSITKTALAASMILASLGLAGCQTTEERVYYTEPAPVRTTTTYVYEDGPRWRPAPRIYVQPRPIYDDGPRWRHRPRDWGGPEPAPYPPPRMRDHRPREAGGPEPAPYPPPHLRPGVSGPRNPPPVRRWQQNEPQAGSSR